MGTAEGHIPCRDAPGRHYYRCGEHDAVPWIAAWGNQARRTLRVMLGKADRDNFIHDAPVIHLAEEIGRDGIWTISRKEAVAVASQPLRT